MINLDAFHDNGYQIIRGAIDSATIRMVGDYLRQELEVLRREGPRRGEESQVLSGHFPLAVRLSPRLWDLPRRPELLDIVERAIGAADVCMHMPPAARFIDPGNGVAAVPPHQDVSYNRHMPDFITVWAPFVDIDETRGGVAVYEGTQAQAEILDTLERDVWLKPVNTDVGRRVACQPMAPGDILLLNQWIVHESIPNHSDKPRLSIDMRFFSKSKGSRKHHLDCRSWVVIDPRSDAAESGDRGAEGPSSTSR
jgi:hypothetical protein